MLTISEVSKSFGPRTLFENVSLQVNREDRSGLVGPNGAGKSTLFSLILESGFAGRGHDHVGEKMPLWAICRRKPPRRGTRRCWNWRSPSPGNRGPATKDQGVGFGASVRELEHHENIHARYDELGGYQLEPKAKRILAGLSFREKDFNRPLREMSGGWVMRAHLARLADAGAGLADAGRADQPPGPGVAAMVPGVFARLSRGHPHDFARPRISSTSWSRTSWKSATAN